MQTERKKYLDDKIIDIFKQRHNEILKGKNTNFLHFQIE